MMKKMVITWIVICITILVGVNLVNGFTGEATDEEIMENYIQDRYGEQCYGTLGDCNEEWIKFYVYENGVQRWCVSVNRDYHTTAYGE